MPNDRKRLKSAAAALEVPEGMGLIIRTAGANRTKVEIKRDYEYLLRLWDTIRELTLKSNAPACIYEEGDLIKRAIRDLYDKDVDEIIVEGDEGYKNAKDFMRMLMPSHAKNVKPYQRTACRCSSAINIEAQLDAMFSADRDAEVRRLHRHQPDRSAGLHRRELRPRHARASIEETAHKTNLEAADEVGRQLRLRDLAGLIVIDFIDMEDSRNDRDVEKRLRDAVKNDRARMQIGKISQFGLLEMSRQRLRAGVVAGSTVPCPHCGGQGIVRSVESTALRVLRALEEEGQKQTAPRRHRARRRRKSRSTRSTRSAANSPHRNRIRHDDQFRAEGKSVAGSFPTGARSRSRTASLPAGEACRLRRCRARHAHGHGGADRRGSG